MNAALLQFLKTSTFDGLGVGTSVSDVITRLGSAFMRTARGVGSEIWKYGPLELTVVKARIEQIKLNCLDIAALPEPLRDITMPPAETTLYEVLEALDSHEIGWQIDSSLTFDRQLCILTEASVRVFFDLDSRELQSMQA